jgi:hypothetical protein
METPRVQLETILRQNRPTAFCFTCLATKLAMPVGQVRDAAQLLVVQSDFRYQRRPCGICERLDEVVWFVQPRAYQAWVP